MPHPPIGKRIKTMLHFPPIRQRIDIRVRIQWIRRVGIHLSTIQKTIPVRIGFKWVRATNQNFHIIGKLILIGVGIHWIGSNEKFEDVGQPIVVLIFRRIGQSGI